MASVLGRALRAGGLGRAPRIGVWCCAMRIGVLCSAMRIWVLCCAIFGAALSVQADYIYWTLNFDEPVNEDEVGIIPSAEHANPTGNSSAYTWLMVAKFSDTNPKTIESTDMIGDPIQLQISVEGGEGGSIAWQCYEIVASQYDSASYRFYVEIGNTSGNPDYHSATWYTLSELRAAGYIKDTFDPLSATWNPAAGGWTAPEPSSGLLLLMGGALLALRRRRRI